MNNIGLSEFLLMHYYWRKEKTIFTYPIINDWNKQLIKYKCEQSKPDEQLSGFKQY